METNFLEEILNGEPKIKISDKFADIGKYHIGLRFALDRNETQIRNAYNDLVTQTGAISSNFRPKQGDGEFPDVVCVDLFLEKEPIFYMELIGDIVDVHGLLLDPYLFANPK